jgi:ribulose-phosphate 3-epimerase
MTKNKTYQLAASVICGNLLDIKSDLKSLEKGAIDHLHFDVMDGVFVPRLGLLPELLAAIHRETSIPINVHLMISKPELYISDFIHAGADIITVHPESTTNIYHLVHFMKKNNMKVGIALNPATPLDVLDYLIDDIDLITVMTINPGILGQKMMPFAYTKIADIRDTVGNRDIIIEIDGGVTPETAPKMIGAGATMLVCGTGTIYQPPAPLETKIKELRKTIDTELPSLNEKL